MQCLAPLLGCYWLWLPLGYAMCYMWILICHCDITICIPLFLIGWNHVARIKPPLGRQKQEPEEAALSTRKQQASMEHVSFGWVDNHWENMSGLPKGLLFKLKMCPQKQPVQPCWEAHLKLHTMEQIVVSLEQRKPDGQSSLTSNFIGNFHPLHPPKKCLGISRCTTLSKVCHILVYSCSAAGPIKI